jgi:hypothetical protein
MISPTCKACRSLARRRRRLKGNARGGLNHTQESTCTIPLAEQPREALHKPGAGHDREQDGAPHFRSGRKLRQACGDGRTTHISAERESVGERPLDGHIWLMSFYICKGADHHVIWFTAIFPAIKWGPQEQALAFRTRGHAQQALARLPKNASRGAKIVDGGTSSAI